MIINIATSILRKKYIMVIMQVSRKFFPDLAVGFEDSRVHLHVGDGIFLSAGLVLNVFLFPCFIFTDYNLSGYLLDFFLSNFDSC